MASSGEQYSHILCKTSKNYAALKQRAIYDNKQLFRSRQGKTWCKQSLTKYERMYIFQHCQGKCGNAHCRKVLDSHFTVEHIMPKSRHPEHTWNIANLTALCHSCNSRKNDRHVYDTDKFRYQRMRTPMHATQKKWVAYGTPKM